MSPRRRAASIGLGLLVSAGALWLTLRGKDLGGVWAELRAADYRYLGWYLVLLLVIHLVRTFRWGLLLSPVASVPFAKLNAVAAVGFMALVLFPLRIGELARPVLVHEPGRLRRSAALSSIVAERVADGLFMGLALVAALLAVPDGAPAVRLLRISGGVMSLVFVAALAFLVVAYRNRALAVRVVSRVARPLSQRAADRVAGMLESFLQGLRLVRGAGRAGAFLGLTSLFWALNAFGIRVLALGFGFDLGPLEAMTVLGVLVVGVMIPAGPGMVGTFQGAVVLGLSLFAPPGEVATRGTAYANVLWAAQIGQQAILGALFLFSRHVRLDRLFAGTEALEEQEADRAVEVGREERG